MRAALVLVLLACAAPAAAQDAGVPAAPPTSRRALPRVDRAMVADSAAALAAFDAAIAMHAPRMTDAIDPQKLNRRVNETFRPWVTHRTAAMQTAQTLLVAAAQRSPYHGVVAAALLALLWEDFAWQISHIAAPRTLRNDPQLAAMWTSLIAEQAAAVRQRGTEAYAACITAGARATPPPDASPWVALCTQRHDALAPPASVP